MHGAIGAFLSEIPATSRFSMNFESNTLEIRVHYQMAPTENAHKEPKKKAPPSKVKRNRQRLAKFLEKPETQPDLPPITSCERSSEGEELVAPPLLTPFEPCIEEEGLEFDTTSVAESEKAPHPSMQTKSSFTCKDREHSGQREEEKGKAEKMDRTNIEKSSDKEDMKKDNDPWLKWIKAKDPWSKWMTDIDDWGTPYSSDWGRPRSPWKENKTETNSTQEDVQPVSTVRVPAHQISDREFVKIERKRRKRKDHQKDCKTS